MVAMLIRTTTLFLLPAIGIPVLVKFFKSLKNFKLE
jgi:hypothetical protein